MGSDEENAGVAVILARGGSKRIPRKNIRSFHGRPIIEYVIEACLESGCFAEVMVSTDDSEIADVAIRAGAQVPFLRSGENSGDHAGIFEVLREVLGAYAEHGRRFSEVCGLLATAPFLTGAGLREARSVLRENAGCGMVLPVVRFGYPIQRAVRIRDGRLAMFSPEYFEARSQDLEAAFHDAGQFYYLDATTFERDEEPSFENAYPLIYPETEVQDIDSEVDWELAELKFVRSRAARI
jgi:N-acylneuraminate cytidylyltransferase